MQTALRFSATVQPGHRIEITDPHLPEGECVEVVVMNAPAPARSPYPAAIESEYQILIDKKLHRRLTNEEAVRLQDIKNIINEIDRVTLADDIRTRQLNFVEAELERLRIEIEALPDLCEAPL